MIGIPWVEYFTFKSLFISEDSRLLYKPKKITNITLIFDLQYNQYDIFYIIIKLIEYYFFFSLSGSNIVPKALPQVTPDSQNHHMNQMGHQNQNYQQARNVNHYNQRGNAVKRRHSGVNGKYRKRKCAFLKVNFSWFWVHSGISSSKK